MSKFARAACNMFARLGPDDDIEDIRKMWDMLDIDDDGIVTTAELNKMLPFLPAGFESLCSKVNLQKNGGMNYTEFLAAMLDDSTYHSRKNCEAAFQVFARGDN